MSDWNPFESDSQNDSDSVDLHSSSRKPTPKGNSSTALRVFLSTVAAALVVALGSLVAVSTAPSFTTPASSSAPSASREPSSSSGGSTESPESTPSYTPNLNAPQFSLSALPQSEALTDQQIVKKVRSSIVSVMVYERSFALNGSDLAGLGEGSGIVMTADGYVLTNAHVIDSRSDVYIRIVLLNGEELHAVVVGYDTRTDLAVLKAETNGELLSPAEFGDSDTCEVGDAVLAFGNPGGVAYANSVTKGILSATNRFLSLDINSLPLLQTDAAINPGNSGGALVNTYGQVIGINSAKVSASDYEGMGFAIPTAQAKTVVNQLLTYGKIINRVRLGIRFSAVSELDASLYNIQPGMQITYLAEDSVFSGTQVQEGDIITAIQGKSVKTVTGFFALLDEYVPGQTVEVTIYRPENDGTPARTFSVNVLLQKES